MYKKVMIGCALIFSSTLFGALNRASLSDLQIKFNQLIKADPQKNEMQLCEILETIFKDPIYTDPKISVGGLTVQQWVASALARLTQILGRNPHCAKLQQIQKQVASREPAIQPQERALPAHNIPVQPQQSRGPQETKEHDENRVLLESCQVEIERLRTQNAQLKTELDQLQKRCVQLVKSDELKKAQDLTAHFQQQLTVAQQELEQLRKQLANRIDRAELDRLRTQLETQIKELQQRLNRTEQELTKAQTDLKNGQEELKKKPKEVIKEVTHEVRVEDTRRIKKLENHIKELEQQNATTIREKNSALEERKKCEEDLSKVRADLESARQAASQAEQKTKELQKYQEQVTSLQNQLAEQKKDEQTQKKNYDEQLAKAQIDARAAQQAAAHAEQKAKTVYEERIADLNQQIANDAITLKQVQDAQKKCEEALAQRPNEKVWQETQLKAQEADRLTGELSKYQRDIDNAKEAFKKLQQKYDTETLTLRAQLDNAKQENLQRAARENDAERALTECRENLEKMTEALAQARRENANLQKSLAECLEEAATIMEIPE